jgi:hypothetical protein
MFSISTSKDAKDTKKSFYADANRMISLLDKGFILIDESRKLAFRSSSNKIKHIICIKLFVLFEILDVYGIYIRQISWIRGLYRKMFPCFQ